MNNLDQIGGHFRGVDSLALDAGIDTKPGRIAEHGWFDDLNRGSEMPIRAPVSPDLRSTLSLTDRVDDIVSNFLRG